MAAFRVLYVDDEPELLRIGKIFLEQEGLFTVDTITSAPEALALLDRTRYDAIVADFLMPEMDGIEFLKRVRKSGNPVPFILFTGRGREEVVIQALNEGADFYLQKGGDPVPQFIELSHKLHQAIRKRLAEGLLHENENKFRTIFENSPYPISINSVPDGKFIAVNAAFLESSGYTEPEVMGKTPVELDLLGLNDLGRLTASFALTGRIEHVPLVLTGKGGRRVHVQFSTIPVSIGGHPAVMTMVAEITRLRRVEEELLQKNQALTTISEMEREFAGLPSGCRVEEVAAKKLQALSGAVVTVFSTYHPADQVLRTTCIEFAPGILQTMPGAWEKVAGWMGMQPDKVEIPVSREQYQDINRSIVGTKKTIAEISYGKVSPLVSASIQKLSGIDRFIHIAHIIDGELYGTSVIGLRQDQPDPSSELLDSFGHLVAVSLRRQQAEQSLRENEEKYRLIADNTADNIWIFDMDFRLQYVSPSVEKMRGFTVGEALALPLDRHLTPDSLASVMDLFKEEMAREAGGTADPHRKVSFETEEYCKDGSTILVENSVTFLRDAAGRPGRILGISRDITERKRAEEALRASEEKYRAIIENMQDLVYQSDLQGNLTMISPAGARLSGYETPAEMLGKNIAREIYADPNERGQLLAELKEKGEVRDYPVTLVDRYGTHHEVTASSHFYSDARGNVLGVEGILHDVTEQRKAEEALRQANRKLSLLSDITRHDIGNQLLTLNGFVALLRKKIPDPGFENYFARIAKASGQIGAMIRFTREYEQIGVHAPVWQDLQGLVNSAGKDILFGKVLLKNDIPSSTEIFADPLIVRVFFNLMDNALRHGGAITTIRFSSALSNGDRIILCEDDGSGVAGEEKERIFDRGFGRNTGFGLAISREILDITGITITENGEPGNGARFEITVPDSAYRANGV